MRSVCLYLVEVSPDQVRQHLDRLCTRDRDSWVLVHSNGDPVLYISATTGIAERDEEIERTELSDAIANRSYVVLVADISGRHCGEAEILRLVTETLSRFEGFAADEYTHHPWSLEEIRSGALRYGHRFFDYRGWHEEDERRRAFGERPD